MTSNIDINVRRVDNDNARTITSLLSSPPVVSCVAITAATMAPLLSTSTTSSLSVGMVSRSASADNGTPPAACSSTMVYDGDNNDNNNGSARDVASPASSQPSRAENPHLPLPNCRPFAPP